MDISILGCHINRSISAPIHNKTNQSLQPRATPVAGYFSQAIDIIAILHVFSTYLRCKQIEYYIKRVIPESKNLNVNNPETIKILHQKNYQTFIYAILSGIGFNSMGNFGSFQHLGEHGIGATLMFLTIPFLFAQKYIAEKLYECDQIESRPISMTIVTYIVSIGWPLISTIFVCSLLIHSSLMDWFNQDLRLNFPNDSPAFYLYRFAIILEWLVIMSYTIMFFIITKRMKLFKHWNRIVY
uniref:Uncharacterized protein LOC113791300 n=1 Tax=Dermatophagoides pteronyssinus TaxID=6956 RepID=A0A6P6XY43_DERPT|nr:uncharacterized protein LOC113791300 [Dermatophagoides pteronyssinus]